MAAQKSITKMTVATKTSLKVFAVKVFLVAIMAFAAIWQSFQGAIDRLDGLLQDNLFVVGDLNSVDSELP